MQLAIDHLLQDPTLRPLIRQIDLPERSSSGDVYIDLLRAIVSQQLSTKAASTIYDRFLDLFSEGKVDPQQLLILDMETLRSVGLSKQKATYIQNVTSYFTNQQLFEVNWNDYSDEELIDLLTKIKGVGVWTVEMILISSLRRPDIFPIGDLAIRKAIIQLYRLESSGKELMSELVKVASRWQPHRTLACRYLWYYYTHQKDIVIED
ncbi:MAG: DNA-3-methyladenine glycosylase 2 family protein [Bacteroidota bacterium]